MSYRNHYSFPSNGAIASTSSFRAHALRSQNAHNLYFRIPNLAVWTYVPSWHRKPVCFTSSSFSGYPIRETKYSGFLKQ